MPEHYTLNIQGHAVEFHIYVNVAGSQTKVTQLQLFLARLPVAHLAVLYPIFVMEHKPGGQNGGGTWPPNLVRPQIMGAAHARNSGVPDADMERFAAARSTGVIGISRDRWERPMGRLEFTLLHEVGHCVDVSLGGLVPAGATAADFAGMETDRCGAGSLIVRRAVEAYARWICSPRKIYHTLPATEPARRANQRLMATLRRSRAFRSVPATWAP